MDHADNVIQLSVPGAPARDADQIERDDPQQSGGQVVQIQGQPSVAASAPAQKFVIPQWVWLAGGAIVFLGLVYFLQRNHLLKTPKRRANPAPKARRRKPKQEYIPADDEVDNED
jgi:hypothetical protein